jgi:hypothetical protein
MFIYIKYVHKLSCNLNLKNVFLLEIKKILVKKGNQFDKFIDIELNKNKLIRY